MYVCIQISFICYKTVITQNLRFLHHLLKFQKNYSIITFLEKYDYLVYFKYVFQRIYTNTCISNILLNCIRIIRFLVISFLSDIRNQFKYICC